MAKLCSEKKKKLFYRIFPFKSVHYHLWNKPTKINNVPKSYFNLNGVKKKLSDTWGLYFAFDALSLFLSFHKWLHKVMNLLGEVDSPPTENFGNIWSVKRPIMLATTYQECHCPASICCFCFHTGILALRWKETPSTYPRQGIMAWRCFEWVVHSVAVQRPLKHEVLELKDYICELGEGANRHSAQTPLSIGYDILLLLKTPFGG